jgi:hypothetical protein
MDQIMPASPHTLPEPLERVKRSQDLQMMLLCNAKERDEGEWADLFQQAGEGVLEQGKALGIVGVKSPPGSLMSLIEVGITDSPGEEGTKEKQEQSDGLSRL